MIKRKYMRTRQLKPGMKLDHPVVDRLGRNLVARGAELDDYMIDSLLKLGIMSVYIQEGEEEENPEQVPTSPEAEKNIERLRTEDRAKVTLSASIRERVSTGIQFIYNNTTSEEMVATTESIADDLMRSIKSNDAIAIDISTLKTSDEYTFKHSVDVATISMIFSWCCKTPRQTAGENSARSLIVAKQQGLSPEEVREIGVCGLLHDIGKTKIPNAILNKPGKLNDDEFAIMRQNLGIGADFLRRHTHRVSASIDLFMVLQNTKADSRRKFRTILDHVVTVCRVLPHNGKFVIIEFARFV